MNREILFRGKRVDNGEWIYGDLLTPTDIMDVWEISENTGMGDRYEIDPETVGQFTGLTDKNGTKIFEGDVFVPYYVTPNGEVTEELDHDSLGIIKWGTAAYVFGKGQQGPDFPIRAYVATEFDYYLPNFGEVYKYSNNIALGEVIGNIFDNPKLLGVIQ